MRGFVALLFAPVLFAAGYAPPAADTRNPLVLTHATVIDVSGGPSKPDYTVTISGDRIVAMGDSASVSVPPGAQVVDATGKFLIPGLWDMHVHLQDGEISLPLFIANGVTGVRVMFGAPQHHEWRKKIEAGELVGPRMVIASPIVDGPKPFWQGSISVANEAQARQAVTSAKQGGADFVKVYSNLPRELFLVIADEAKKQGIAFEGHVPDSVSAEEASNAGQKSFEHLLGILPACSTHRDELLRAQQEDLADVIASKVPVSPVGPRSRPLRQMMLDTYSPEKAAALFTLLKSNGTWQCPTLTVQHAYANIDDAGLHNDPRLRYVSPYMQLIWSRFDVRRSPARQAYLADLKKEFPKDLEVVGAMQKAGLPILAGTDESNPFCFPGFGLHDELGFLVQAGLSPLEASQAATLNPAKFLGREKDFGSVETGKIADLVLLDANPLEDVANTNRIHAVIFAGRLYPRAALDEMLANGARLASQTSMAGSALIWLLKTSPLAMSAATWMFFHQEAVAQIALVLLLVVYVYVALALMTLARKTGTTHGWWAWVPVMNLVLMLSIARKPVWWIVLLLIPLVNIVLAALIWKSVAETRQKSGWWGAVAIVPVVNLVVPGYLAWSV